MDHGRYFRQMHLCADFHAGPSKEYLIFFLLLTKFLAVLNSVQWSGFLDIMANLFSLSRLTINFLISDVSQGDFLFLTLLLLIGACISATVVNRFFQITNRERERERERERSSIVKIGNCTLKVNNCWKNKKEKSSSKLNFNRPCWTLN